MQGERAKIEGASWRKPRFAQTDRHPVVCLSQNDARVFCQWLSRKEGKSYRLPTEAEWEYACRAGSTTKYSFGERADELHRYANFADRSVASQRISGQAAPDETQDDGYAFTAPVGSLEPNAWGLYDMHGNAFEWVADWDAGQYPAGRATDPLGPASGRSILLRGGAWNWAPASCRSAMRGRGGPAMPFDATGFRVALDVDAPIAPD